MHAKTGYWETLTRGYSQKPCKISSNFSVFLGCIFFKTGVYTFLYIKRTIKGGGDREKVERGRRGQKKEGGYTRSLAHAQVCKYIFFSNITLHKKILRYMSTAILHNIKKY